jgi:queuine tRNA-ribosyltransferase
MTRFSFDIHATDGKARTGEIHMARGTIRTPAFMPVGTAATVKAMKPGDVRVAGADIILGNTYHLMLRPGAERMARLGGLHRFMNWPHPILTDSGGYQVMSLGALVKMKEEGVSFQSHVDGAKHFVSPERSIEIQRLLGSDIVMAFDECTPFPATRERAESSMRLSMRWARRSRDEFLKTDLGALFGIQQGSMFEDLRRESAEKLQEIGFEGYAIGGLAVGEGQQAMFEVLDYAPDMLPPDRPRYLMGVGKPSDIIGAVLRGVDMFDCVLPTVRPDGPGLHTGWDAEPAQRPARRGHDAAGRGLPVPRVRQLQPGLSAPSCSRLVKCWEPCYLLSIIFGIISS